MMNWTNLGWETFKMEPTYKFSLKLGRKTYKGKLRDMNFQFFEFLNLIEMFGKKQYDFMIRNEIVIDDDDKGLWKFIQNHFEKRMNNHTRQTNRTIQKGRIRCS